MSALLQDIGSQEQAGATELRLWLRLLACSSLIEAELRRRLRQNFGTTLPRFDLMAQLERAPEGIALGELSKRMMVSNGNVTGLVERLVAEGLVERNVSPNDRRSTHVRLSGTGERVFAEMADAHRRWIAELFAELSEDAMQHLWRDLGALKASVGALDHGKEQP